MTDFNRLIRAYIENNNISNSMNDDYAFLDNDPLLGENIIMLVITGSHANGTNMETSDLDIRGIYMNSYEEWVLGLDSTKYKDEKTDTVLYSFKHTMDVFKNDNPNMLEMIGAKPEHYLYISPLGKKIIENAKIFLSKSCTNSFTRMASNQIYKLKQKSSHGMTEEELHAHMYGTFTKMKNDLTNSYDTSVIDFSYDDTGVYADFSAKHVNVHDFGKLLEIMNNTSRAYKKNKKQDDYTKPTMIKNALHALRVLYVAEDILREEKVVMYREKEHDLLMMIRRGELANESGYPTDEYFKLLEEQTKRVEQAAKESALPDKVDPKLIDAFMMEAFKKYKF